MLPEPAEVSTELAEAALTCTAWVTHADPPPLETASIDPAFVLTTWVNSATALLGLRKKPWQSGLCVLHELSMADGAMTVAELAAAIRKAAGRDGAVQAGTESDEVRTCERCGLKHDLSPVGDMSGEGGADRDISPVGILATYGTVAWADAGPHGMIWLTPLGRMLATSIFAGCAPAAGAQVSAVVEELWKLPPTVMVAMARPWLAGRSAPAAVRDLLGYAEQQAGNGQGRAALALAEHAGPDGAPAWREWARKPGFGVYARNWLSEHGEPVPAQPTDAIWLGIDKLMVDMADHADVFIEHFGELQRKGLPISVENMMSALRDSGHPAAAQLIFMLTSGSELSP